MMIQPLNSTCGILCIFVLFLSVIWSSLSTSIFLLYGYEAPEEFRIRHLFYESALLHACWVCWNTPNHWQWLNLSLCSFKNICEIKWWTSLVLSELGKLGWSRGIVWLHDSPMMSFTAFKAWDKTRKHSHQIRNLDSNSSDSVLASNIEVRWGSQKKGQTG